MYMCSAVTLMWFMYGCTYYTYANMYLYMYAYKYVCLHVHYMYKNIHLYLEPTCTYVGYVTINMYP